MIMRKEELRLKWMDIVFENLEKLQDNILFSIENSTFDDKILDKRINELRMCYGGIDNLKKSFKDNSYFVGFVE